jgi:UDP-galactopyranose mutase
MCIVLNVMIFQVCELLYAVTMTKSKPPLLVFSHLRWDFVFQRPQHLLTRCARSRDVYFVEEPQFFEGTAPALHVSKRGEHLYIAVPHLPPGLSTFEVNAHLKRLVDELVAERTGASYIAWYYTPMALKFTRHLKPLAVVYDCMDELSNFKLAPPELCILEDDLFDLADVVFTGGPSLYEHKRHKHGNIHSFPSSVDVAHFRKARADHADPADQHAIARPRIGFTGVIDERFDIELLRGVAEMRPDWQYVMVGPVVKIDPATLPNAPNIHYLGPKSYDELPAYLAGWDVAMLPFARNDATRFISPTKTPEYLAAGRRVVSTSIRDVVRVYGDAKLVEIADEPGACVCAIDRMLREAGNASAWLNRVDAFLQRMSWDETFHAMWKLVEAAVEHRHARAARKVVRRRGAMVTSTPAPTLGLDSVSASPSG